MHAAFIYFPINSVRAGKNQEALRQRLSFVCFFLRWNRPVYPLFYELSALSWTLHNKQRYVREIRNGL